MNGNTGGVNLNVRGICEVCTLTIALDSSCTVTTHSIGREEVGVTITTSSNHYGIGAETLQLTSNEVLGNDTTSTTVNDDYILHLVTGIELHLASLYLTAQRAIGTQQQLLTGLTLSIECTAYLSTTERTVSQHATILTGKGNTLSHALVDDVVRHLSQAIDVSLASTIVTTLHGVVEQTIDRVTIVLIALGGIDTTLGSDRVSTTGRVLNAQVDDVEAHLTQRSCCRGTSQASTNDNDVELQLVLGVNQTLMSLIFFPFLRHWSCRNL